MGADASLTQHGVGRGCVLVQLEIRCGRVTTQFSVGRGPVTTRISVGRGAPLLNLELGLNAMGQPKIGFGLTLAQLRAGYGHATNHHEV